jgi:hypothetical protein
VVAGAVAGLVALRLRATFQRAFEEAVSRERVTNLLVPSRFVLEFVWRGLRSEEDTGSGSEVNRLVSELLG